MEDQKQKFTQVAVTRDTHRLIRHIAIATDASYMNVIFSGIKLLQQKLDIPDPPAVKLPE